VRKVLVTGSRDWPYPESVYAALFKQYNVYDKFILIHGDCPNGADAIAKQWILDNPTIAVEDPHPADWERFGKSAGFKRNAEMILCQPDVVLGFRMNMSKGTSHTLGLAQDAKIPSLTYDVYTQ